MNYDPPPFESFDPRDTLSRLNILIYGDAGSGKTVLAGSSGWCEHTKPALLIDAEGGSLSIATTLGDPTDRIIARRITKFSDDMNQTYSYLANKHHPFATAIWDSGTELQKACMREILDKSILTQTGRKAKDTDVPDVRNWQQSGERMRKYIRYYRDMPIHFVMTCLAQQTKNEVTGAVTVLPALPGALSRDAPGYFDIVGYMQTGTDDKGNMRRVLRVQPEGNWVAKDRTNKLDSAIINPTISSIFEAIFSDSDSVANDAR